MQRPKQVKRLLLGVRVLKIYQTSAASSNFTMARPKGLLLAGSDEDDDRKPAARQEAPESPPFRQRPRISNHAMITRSSTRTRPSQGQASTSRASSQQIIDLTNSPGTPLADNQPEWACPTCTLLNAQTSRRCDACNSPRPDAPNDNAPPENLQHLDASFLDGLIDPTSSSSSSRRLPARNRARVEPFMSKSSKKPRQPPRPPSQVPSAKDEEDLCCICFEELENGKKKKSLKCCHEFHDKCINKWLKQSNECPLCKSYVPESSVKKKKRNSTVYLDL